MQKDNETNLMKITSANVNAMIWPTMAERLESIDEAYLLSTDDRTGKIIVLAVEDDCWKIMEDIWSDSGESGFHEITIDEQGIAAFASLLNGQTQTDTRDSAGRPPVYRADKEGADIFVRHVYGGETIRAIAKDMSMSPSTIQKLLNEARMHAAEQIVIGNTRMAKDSPYWKKNIAVLRWAMKRLKGQKRKEYEKFIDNIMK